MTDAPAPFFPYFTLDALTLGPGDLSAQLPAHFRLLRILPGPDRPDYVLARLTRPLAFQTNRAELACSNLSPERVDPRFVVRPPDAAGRLALSIALVVMAARLVGTQIVHGVQGLGVNFAYVIDGSLYDDQQLDFSKCVYVGVGFVSHHGQGDHLPLTALL
ncbi:MAG: hypothetical protein LBI84_06995 [Propionibacteriaceae bacterium]|jgi:hypothetical protein|nr:hypothetical protein [Propionibacteriaceae bacterium]